MAAEEASEETVTQGDAVGTTPTARHSAPASDAARPWAGREEPGIWAQSILRKQVGVSMAWVEP